jgi:hypothetical protein
LLVARSVERAIDLASLAACTHEFHAPQDREVPRYQWLTNGELCGEIGDLHLVSAGERMHDIEPHGIAQRA